MSGLATRRDMNPDILDAKSDEAHEAVASSPKFASNAQGLRVSNNIALRNSPQILDIAVMAFKGPQA